MWKDGVGGMELEVFLVVQNDNPPNAHTLEILHRRVQEGI